MFESKKRRLRKTAQLLIGFSIVVFFTWFIAGQFTEASQKGKDAVKKFELRQLSQAITLYELTYSEFPSSRNYPDWCVVGKNYQQRDCLYELRRDGFMAALPVSPDDHPYLYISRGSNAFVGVSFGDEHLIPEGQVCDIKDIKVWCLKVQGI